MAAGAIAFLAAAPGAGAADRLTGRLLVTLEPSAGASAAAAGALATAAGASVRGPRVPQIGLVTVRPGPGRTPRAVARALRARPGVRSVAVEHRARLRAVPDDPALVAPETAPGTPPGTAVQWWAARTNLPSAWDVTGGAGAVVGVIDTGVDATHPELAGRIAAAVDLDADPAHGPATTDENGHGTHVASQACAASGNGIGLAGAGLHCRLLVFKSDLSDASVAAAIVDAADRGVEALNMSFGTEGGRPATRALVRAVEYAVRRDVVLVAAAADEPTERQGNPADVLQPLGTGPTLAKGLGLAVTAATSVDARASFAGRGGGISLAAYGTFAERGGPPGLLGAFPAQPTELERGDPRGNPVRPCGCRTTFGGDGRYAYLQGTSMAAPAVAATAALARRLNPDLSAPEVVTLLKQTARRAAGTAWEPELGWGLLDAGAALAAARGLDRRAPVSRVRAPRRARGRSITLRLSFGDPAPSGVAASGVARVEVFRSTGGRRAARVATTARRHTLRLPARPGGRYAFYTVAMDRAGNRERRPGRPDAVTRVAPAG